MKKFKKLITTLLLCCVLCVTLETTSYTSPNERITAPPTTDPGGDNTDLT